MGLELPILGLGQALYRLSPPSGGTGSWTPSFLSSNHALTLQGVARVPSGSIYVVENGYLRYRELTGDLTSTGLLGEVNAPILGMPDGAVVGVYAPSGAGQTPRAIARFDVDAAHQVERVVHLAGNASGTKDLSQVTPAESPGWDVKIFSGQVTAMTLASDGAIYFASSPTADSTNLAKIFRLTPQGRVSLVAGGGSTDLDNAPASGLAIKLDGTITAMAAGSGGILYFAVSQRSGSKASGIFRTDTTFGQIARAVGVKTGDPAETGDGGPPLRAGVSDVQGLALGPDGTLYFSETAAGPSYRIRRVTQPQLLLADYRVASEDGALVYTFHSDGRHYKTEEALTGHVLVTFGYDPQGRLSTATTDEGLTQISGTGPVTITGPYQHQTVLTLTGGYVTEIRGPMQAGGPDGERWRFDYQADGLLRHDFDPRTLSEASLGFHTYVYDGDGLLVRDEDPSSSVLTLDRTQSSTGYDLLFVGTGSELNATHAIDHRKPGEEELTTTHPDGSVYRLLRRADATVEISADQITTVATLAPDPRYGTQAPYVKTAQVTTGGKSAAFTTTRVLPTGSITPPMTECSTQQLTETVTVNGKTWTVDHWAQLNAQQVTTIKCTVETSPGERTVKTKVDLVARTKTVSVPGLADVITQYDASWRPQAMSQTAGGQTRQVSWSYDATLGQGGSGSLYRTDVAYASGATTALRSQIDEFDPVGRPKKATGGIAVGAGADDRAQLGMTYDKRGWVRTLDAPINPNQTAKTHTFTLGPVGEQQLYSPPPTLLGAQTDTGWDYDAHGRLWHWYRPDARDVTLNWNGAKLESIVGQAADGFTTDLSLVYGYVGGEPRPWTVTTLDQVKTTYSYAGALLSSRTTEQIPGLTGQGFTTTYGYDHELRPTSVGVTWTGGGTPVSVGYQYDEQAPAPTPHEGLLWKVTAGAGTLSFKRMATPNPAFITEARLQGTNAVVTKPALNGFGEEASDEAQYALGQNETGTPFFRVRHEGTKYTGGAAFVRDQLGRVTHEEEWVEQGTVVGTLPAAPSRVRDFTYDTLGRLKTETAVTGAGTRTRTYAYDANGNRTAVTDSQAGQSITTTLYDQQDRLIDYGTTHYEHTPSGERRERRRGDQTKTQYGYDELGALRWVRELDGSGYQTRRIDYQVDGEGHRIAKTVKVGGGTAQVVQRFVWSGALQLAEERNPNGSLKWTFAYASRPNVPDFMVGANGDVYRLVTDPLGSVRLVVNVSSGAVAQRLRYDAFGNVEEDTAAGFQPFGFAGGLYDPDTKLVRFGARDYDPEVGRWTAKDPLGFGGGDSNVFVYCGGDPINCGDPSGLWSLKGFMDSVQSALLRNSDWISYQARRWGFGLAAAGLGGAGAAAALGIAAVPVSLGAVGASLGGAGAAVSRGCPGAASSDPGPMTRLFHGGNLVNGAVQAGRISTTPSLGHAQQYAAQNGGQVYEFQVPTRWLMDMVAAGRVMMYRDLFEGTAESAIEYRFSGQVSAELNQFLVR